MLQRAYDARVSTEKSNYIWQNAELVSPVGRAMLRMAGDKL